jgi:hypothetical protein
MAKSKGSSRNSGSKGSSSGGKHRSAVSGKYVTAKYGRSHPKTTVKESK